MLSVDDAQRVAQEAFPHGPERLVKILKPLVEVRPLGGCDGMCIARGDQAVIFLNEAHGEARRRFTLAHELGHLLLGIPPTAGESLADMLTSDNEEERQVNAVAAELLLPQKIVAENIKEIPVVAEVLKRFAKLARVSELTTALRVADLATDLGLEKASVVHFDGGGVKWQWSHTIKMKHEKARRLLRETRQAPHGVLRLRQRDATVVASTIEKSFFDSATLFVQVLPEKIANNVTSDERRKGLEAILYSETSELKTSMEGRFGALRNRIEGKTPAQVENDFWQRYLKILSTTELNSDEGREYVRLRINQWY